MAMIRFDIEDGAARMTQLSDGALDEYDQRIVEMLRVRRRWPDLAAEVWHWRESMTLVAVKCHWPRPENSPFDSTWELGWAVRDGFDFIPDDGLRVLSLDALEQYYNPNIIPAKKN